MNELDATKYSVIVATDPGSPFGKLLSQFASKVQLTDGRELLNFWCSEVDASHPIYLALVAHKPTTEPGLRLRIPHHQVLLISDPGLLEKTIGFVQT